MSVFREMLARAVLASFGIPLLCLLGWLGGWWWYAVVLGITILALGEFYSGCFAKGFRPPAIVCYAWAAVLLAAAMRPPHQAWPLLAVTILAAGMTIAMRTLTPPRHEYVGTTAAAIFGLVYIAGGLSFLWFLRHVDIPALLSNAQAWSFAHRMGAVVLVVLPVWASDTGAFLAGGLWGKHKLAPRLSPAKTWEGAIGGLVSTVAGVLLIGGLWLGMPLTHCIALGMVMGVACQLGDAIESAIKRDLGLKDFGTLFGPHGGVLDRFDGLLVAMPVTYLYLLLAFGAHASFPGL